MVECKEKPLNKFRKFVKLSYPKECCGFLLGVELISKTCIDEIYIPLDQDRWTTPDKIDVQDHWWEEAEDRAKELKLDVIGFIHSHPDYRDTSMSENDLKMTDYIKYQLDEVENPVMGIVGVWNGSKDKKVKRVLTRVSFWPMFNQHKICLK